MKSGDSLCGDPGDDIVNYMTGGHFWGNVGDDWVEFHVGGTFDACPVHDAASLLADLAATAVAAPATALDCHHTFPAGGGVYDAAPVAAGQVICGGPGDDVVAQMDGGRFFGGGGNDPVDLKNGGFFLGNAGRDSVGSHYGGTFVGGLDRDHVDSF